LAQTLAFLSDIGRFCGKILDLGICHVIDDLASEYALERVKETVFNAEDCNIIDESQDGSLVGVSR
jgi:hypothetical protein